jgi:hypothetical protein
MSGFGAAIERQADINFMQGTQPDSMSTRALADF